MHRWSVPALRLLKWLYVQEELYPSLGDLHRWSGPTLRLLKVKAWNPLAVIHGGAGTAVLHTTVWR